MWKYEILMCQHNYLTFIELSNFPSVQDGYIFQDTVYINENLTPYRKHEIVAEEIAHFKMNAGNILDQTKFNNRKFEGYARRKTYEMLMPLDEIKSITFNGITSLYEISNYFEVTEKFVKSALSYYIKKDKLPKTILSM